MPLASSHSYKKYSRQQRKTVNEGVFGKGMNYSDNPLESGSCRLLVNYLQKDYGERIKPRGGWRQINDPIVLGSGLPDTYVHHTGTAFVTNPVTGKVFLRRYAMILAMTANIDYGSTEHSVLMVEEPYDVTNPNIETYQGLLKKSTYKVGGVHQNIKHDARKSLVEAHDMYVMYPSPIGIYSSIEGNTYMPTLNGLGRLHIYFDGTNYTHEIKLVAARDLTPGTAVNSGYNLLSDNPYTFINNSLGSLVITGILPYNATTNKLHLAMKVGERVRFKMFYDYEATKLYKVKWEVQDIQRETRDLIQTQQASPNYTNGAEIYIDTTVQYRRFSVIATVYDSTDLVNPLQTMVAAFYTLADGRVAMLEPVEYDLMTADGMTVWKNQIVYWGVEGAEMSIFISDVNDPTYMPFPNNSMLFNERVVNAFPFMEGMMVATESTMFFVDFDMEAGFTSKPVQSSMNLDSAFITGMFAVRNMVSFKSKEYYYLIVPNIKTLNGELQIAPISNVISHFLDEFKVSMTDVLRNLYTLEYTLGAPMSNISIELYDYHNYLDGSRIRHVYKLLIGAGSEGAEDWYYVDAHLVYDTISRGWTVEFMESTRRPVHVFQALSTGYAQFINIVDVDGVTQVQWLTIDENNLIDENILDGNFERTFHNYQMLDTGKRALEGNMQKRFRMAILELNNLSKEDIRFHHVSYVDDQPRNDLYKYVTTQIIDPSDPEYGRIYVERDLAETVLLDDTATDMVTFFGTTSLGEWSLGNSQFPQQTILKAHLEFTGKGYYPRIILVTNTSKLYELNSVSWVYRDMNTK